MSDVYVTTYLVVGDSVALADAHFAEIDRVTESHKALMLELGAVAYRPGPDGRIWSLWFTEAKPGYKPTGEKTMRDGQWVEERRPRLNTNEGKAIQAKLDAAERLPSDFAFAKLFGWEIPRIYPGSGNRVYFPTVGRTELPYPVNYLRLPRKADDGWIVHQDLRAVPEDRLMEIIANHNRLMNS